MKDTDGFTIIDYIKSSIEILMNMKIEENDQAEGNSLASHHSRKRKKHNH